MKCLFAKIFVKDPKKRITMDEMRSDAWVNFEEKELPSRILPKVVGSNDLADISQFISGITSDTNAVIYTLHRHTVVVPEVTTVRSSSIFHKRGKSNLVRLAIKAGKQNEDNCTEDNITPLSPANGNTGSRRRLNSANSPLSPKSPDFPSQPQNHQRAKSLSISRKSDSTSSNPRTVQVARRMSTIGPSVQEQKLEEKSKPERRNSLMSKTTTSNDPRPSVGPPKLFRSPSSVMDDINPFSVQDQDLNVTAEEIIDWHTFHKPPTEIRTVRFSFSASMTSTLPPALIFRNSHDAILELHDEFPSLKVNRVEEYYMMTGSLKSHEDVNVSFEIEVCKVWQLKVHGIRFKRLSGDPFLYKEVYKKFAECFERLNLNSIGV